MSAGAGAREGTPRRSTRKSASLEPPKSNADEEPVEFEEPEGDEDFTLKAEGEGEGEGEGENEGEEEDEYEEDEDEDLEDTTKSKATTPAPGEEQEELEDDGEEGEDLGEDDEGRAIKKQKVSAAPGKVKKVKGRRGRKPAIPQVPLIEEEQVFNIVDDEYQLPEDEEGEKKITKDGVLQGGRQYRVRTFTLKGKGNRLYMLSTEPARCVGFRDSYLFFQKHKFLYKVILSLDEKFDLIDRDIIPHSYKGRVISLVTARSIFREFGAKIIVGGRNITDDYYVTKIRERGQVVEGTLADPADEIPPSGTAYNTKQFVAWHGASSVYHASGAVAQPYYEPIELKSVKTLKSTNKMNEETWMYQHAKAARDFETVLLKGRTTISRGLRDPYTGLTFVPQLTQPSHVTYRKIEGPNDGHKKKLVFETVVRSANLAKKTGLSDVPLEIFDGLVNEETKKAILKQQEYERTQLL